MPPTDGCKSVRETAAYYGVAPAKVRLWIKRRQLRAIDVGERRQELRIPPDAMRDFEERRAVAKPIIRQKRDAAVDPEIEALLA